MTTIFALSSGALPAAIAVVRISGPAAFDIAHAIAGSLPPPRNAGLRTLRDNDGNVLDRAIVIAFPAPATATGEDLVEFQLHGGRAVVRAVEDAIARDARARRAEPGEFTRRALDHGRIDLTQAEGLADLLAAETEAQRRTAILTSDGMLRRSVDELVGRVVSLSARAEAALDFADEEDVGQDAATVDAIRTDAAALARTIAEQLAVPTTERLRDGFRVVLAGPPNSGKSTLINRMAQRDVAIVSPIAGTTRDRIEAPVVHGGLPFVLTDTAGITGDTDDEIEAIGVQRAHAAIDTADILLWLGDTAPPVDGIHVFARCDLAERRSYPNGRMAVSALTYEGIDALWGAILDRAQLLVPPAGAAALNQRQHDRLSDACRALTRAGDEFDILLVAESLREARTALDRITGRADVEAMLDSLFGRFCVGK